MVFIRLIDKSVIVRKCFIALIITNESAIFEASPNMVELWETTLIVKIKDMNTLDNKIYGRGVGYRLIGYRLTFEGMVRMCEKSELLKESISTPESFKKNLLLNPSWTICE